MKKFIQRAYYEIRKFSLMYKELEVSAHAAASSFYIFLSIIPLIALVLTIIPYTPIKQEQLNEFLSLILPMSLNTFIESATVQMYGEGPVFLIISAVSLLWSAGKGMQAITRGLNAVYGVKHEKRSFILLRLEACIYTILLVVILILFVTITFVAKYALTRIGNVFHIDLEFYITLLNNRYLFEWFFLAIFFALLYGLVPYRKVLPHRMWNGAVVAGVTCTLFSQVFSFYLEHFHGFSMYGSMATIILTMIWIFIFMTVFFAGALLNVYIEQFKEQLSNRKRARAGQNIYETEVLYQDIDDYRKKGKKKKKKALKKTTTRYMPSQEEIENALTEAKQINNIKVEEDKKFG